MIDLKPACSGTIELLRGFADEQLPNPTPCTEYTVGDLVEHLDVVALGFADVARNDGGVATAPSGERRGDGWREDVVQHVRSLGEAWDDPAAWRGRTTATELDLPNELWGRIALTEVVVHGWDLARATDQSFDLPEETLRACLEHVTEFLPNAPVEELWGPAVEVPDDAPLIDQVVAATGRASQRGRSGAM